MSDISRPAGSSAVPAEGFLYLAWGDPRYFEEAVDSCLSLRAVAPNAHVTIAADGASDSQLARLRAVFDQVVVEHIVEQMTYPPEAGSNAIAFTYKTRVLSQSAPYRRTFYVDTDTYFTSDPRGLFKLLDHFDVAVGPAPGDLTPIRDASGEIVTGYTPYNTGVILFNRDDTRALLGDWERRQSRALLEMNDAYIPDQTTFAQALLESRCRFYVMQTAWNARLPYPERFAGPVAVVHAHLSEIGGLSLEQAAARVNATHGVRVWMPGLNAVIYRTMGVHRWLWLSVRGVPFFLGNDLYRLARTVYRRLPEPLRRLRR